LPAPSACGIYVDALGSGFVSNEPFQLFANPLITASGRIPEIFQPYMWAFAAGEARNNCRPMRTLVYLVLYRIFGFDALVVHLVIVFFHGANTLLPMSFLARRLLRSRDAALVAGIVFAFHPIHSESEAWIAIFSRRLAHCRSAPKARCVADMLCA
jgi:hypothetical protein